MCACVRLCLGGGRGGGQTGLISTAWLHLITLPSSAGPARSPTTHARTQCHCHWQVPVIKTPSYHISNYTGNCRWNWKSFGRHCPSPLSLPPPLIPLLPRQCGRVWKGTISNPSLVLDVLLILFPSSMTKSFRLAATPVRLQRSARLIVYAVQIIIIKKSEILWSETCHKDINLQLSKDHLTLWAFKAAFKVGSRDAEGSSISKTKASTVFTLISSMTEGRTILITVKAESSQLD